MSSKQIVLSTGQVPTAYVNDVPVLQFKAADVNGQPVTPSTAVLTVRDPRNNITTPTCTITQDAIAANVPLPYSGTWKWKLVATAPGSLQGALEGSFVVERAKF